MTTRDKFTDDMLERHEQIQRNCWRIIAAVAAFWVLAIGGAVYVVAHFIAKFW